MIYRKEEYVEHCEEDAEFPIRQIDCLIDVADDSRRFLGRAVLNVQTPYGVQQVPVSFEIEADEIQAAFAKYVETAKPAIDDIRTQLQERFEEARRQEQSRIVTPGEVGGGGGIVGLDGMPR